MQTSKPRHFKMALALALFATVGPFSIDTYLPAMQEIGSSLQTTQVLMQQSLSIYLLCYSIMLLWHGALSDSIGRRPVVIVATSIFVLASIGCALSDSIGSLLIYRGIQGLCGGAGMIIGRAMIRDRFDGHDAQKMMSQVTMLFSLAPGIAPVIGGFLFTHLGWRSIFVFMALLGILVVVVAVLLPETHPKENRQAFNASNLLRNYWQVGKKVEFLLLTFAISFNFAGFFLYIPSAPVFILKHLNLDPQAFFWLFGPAVGGIMFGAFLSGKLAGRRSAKEMVSLGYVVMFTAALFNVFWHMMMPASLPMSVIPLALYTTGMSMAAPSIMITLMDQFPHLRGTVSSVQGFIQTMLSSLIAGIIAPLIWSSVLSLAIGMLVCLMLGFAFRSAYRYRIDKIALLKLN